MRLVTWNVNHRARVRRIPDRMAEAVGVLRPDILILTEFVPDQSRCGFLAAIAELGLREVLHTPRVVGQNSVLVASRFPLAAGYLEAPNIDSAFPSNVLHVRVPEFGLDVLGVRIPDYSKVPQLKREAWDWLEAAATGLLGGRALVLGDLNTDARYPPARCGDRIGRLIHAGWTHAIPEQGASYWTPRGVGARIDHAFVSPNLGVASREYVEAREDLIYCGKGPEALSDHAALAVEVTLQ